MQQWLAQTQEKQLVPVLIQGDKLISKRYKWKNTKQHWTFPPAYVMSYPRPRRCPTKNRANGPYKDFFRLPGKIVRKIIQYMRFNLKVRCTDLLSLQPGSFLVWYTTNFRYEMVVTALLLNLELLCNCLGEAARILRPWIPFPWPDHKLSL